MNGPWREACLDLANELREAVVENVYKVRVLQPVHGFLKLD